ncbi:MAG: hypothetical protein JWM10_3326 [Myxococcaceae bacterium]|nr:hypothetical protein [Myxococcaceae bacterium]
MTADVDIPQALQHYLWGRGFPCAALLLSRVVDEADRQRVLTELRREMQREIEGTTRLADCHVAMRRPLCLRRARRRLDELNALWVLTEAFDRRCQAVAGAALAAFARLNGVA